MKIAIIGPAHPLRGGLATYDQRLAEELQHKGHEVVIYSFSLQYPSFLFPGTTQYSSEPAPPGLDIRTIINSVNPLNWLSTGRMMNKQKYDLIIVRFWIPFMGPALGTILRLAKKNGHTRVLCIADNIIPHEKRPGDKPFTNYFIKPVDTFLTMSRDVLRDVGTMTNKPAVFSPHPVYDTYGASVSKEEACAFLKLDPSKDYMLFFGFIRDYKGLDILLQAMADERIRKSGVHLLVAGEYYDKALAETCKQLMEQHQLSGYVHMLTDFIPDSQVKYYFSAASLIVQPYKHATQSGITLVAYQFEKPMIVTNVGGLAEIVPDNKVGYVAEPDATSIAEAILKFYQGPAIPQLQENILREKSKYSWDTFTKVLLGAVFDK